MMSKLKVGQQLEANQATWLIRLLWVDLGISGIFTVLSLIVGEPEELNLWVSLLGVAGLLLAVLYLATAIFMADVGLPHLRQSARAGMSANLR